MNKADYQKLVKRKSPKENWIKNGILVFISGGILGSLSELLLNCYATWLSIPRKDAGILVILTLIVISSLLTAFGVFDVLVNTFKSALIIPITGFAHSITSAALEYKNEGLILGIGANIFKLGGTVILYGVVSVYIFGLIRLLLVGG
ncbi:MAG: SpoVA/SpoVAEb family sporulation membrane protein [bacterium]|nr:SpoVA/SpoVAEb family sporulation membrane protein [bacterium]